MVTDLGLWPLEGGSLQASIVQPPTAHPAVIRTVITRDDGRQLVLDLDARQARTAGDLLDMFDPANSGQISGALSRAADLLDQEESC